MNAFDIWLFGHINANASTSAELLQVAEIITKYLPTIALASLIPMIFMGPRYRRILFSVIMSMALGWMAARGIRELVPSSRPFAIGLGFQGMEHARTASFPSMHATVAGAWAASLCIFSPIDRRVRWAVAVIPVALLIAWSRVFLGLHFPLDIIAGLLLGHASALMTLKIKMPAKLLNKNKNHP